MMICPICRNDYDGRYPALSRRDNKTEICPNCGVMEAMEDLYWNKVKKNADAKTKTDA
jgi:hypothetical protein